MKSKKDIDANLVQNPKEFDGEIAFKPKKTIFLKFINCPDFQLARYLEISSKGFSCFCNKATDKGDKFRVDLNLKMLTGGFVDDDMSNIAVVESMGSYQNKGKTVNKFKLIRFEGDCQDSFVKTIAYLNKMEQSVLPPDVPASLQPDSAGRTTNVSKKAVWALAKEASEKIKKGKINLPVLPKIVHEIQDTLKDPASTAGDLADVIVKDASIAVKLIATANSPLYKGRETIRSIRQSIPRLGIKETQSLVLAIANKGLYKTNSKHFSALLEKIWLHSLACAYLARAIADKRKLSDPERFFSIGLVHDIGKTMLVKVLSDQKSQGRSLSTIEVTTCIKEFSPSVSGIILRHWKFTKDFVRAATMHDGPIFDRTTEKVVLVMNIANNLAQSLGYGIEEDEVDIDGLESIKLLKIDLHVIEAIMEETNTIMDSVAGGF